MNIKQVLQDESDIRFTYNGFDLCIHLDTAFRKFKLYSFKECAFISQVIIGTDRIYVISMGNIEHSQGNQLIPKGPPIILFSDMKDLQKVELMTLLKQSASP